MEKSQDSNNKRAQENEWYLWYLCDLYKQHWNTYTNALDTYIAQYNIL